MFWKTFVVYLALTALAVGGVAAVATHKISTHIWDDAYQRLRDVAITARGMVQDALTRRDAAELRVILSKAFSDAAERKIEVSLLDADGRLLAEVPPGEVEQETGNHPEIQQASRINVTGSDRRLSAKTGLPTLYFATAVRVQDELVGFVRTGMSEVDVQKATRRASLEIWLVALLVWFATALVAGYWTAKQFRPFSQLAASAKALAAGEDSEILFIDRSDEIGALATAIGDIRTRRMHGALQLREKSELLVSVLENMLEGVIAIASDEKVLLANGASGRMLGFAAANAVGRPLPEVSRSRALHDCVRQALTSGRPSRNEIESPGESRRTLAVSAAPLSDERSAGVLIVLHDVSEIRRLENLRREFVANVSHELKTPLSSIKAYAETLRLGAIHDAEHRMGFVERIEEQAERLHELIIDLLQLARIEAGQQAFDFDDVHLLEVARSCVQQFGEAAAAKKIQLSIDENSPRLVVHVDEEGLRTVLNNLIDNGIKYTPADGRVRISWRSEGGYGVIAVEDTGIGIALRDQTRIFERFFRVDKARSRELGGTGLGLSIVKHLCQAFGGDVFVESQEGVGSTFRVRLPLAPASLAR